MFAKHVPPSANRPRVLVLEGGPEVDLPEAAVALRIGQADGPCDAVAGYAAPDPALDNLESFYGLLRPGGRLILAAQADPKALLEALVQGGFRHCLVEPQPDGWVLYRGERPDLAGPALLAEDAAGAEARAPFFYVPVEQTPNKPAWQRKPGEAVTWRAPTLRGPDGLDHPLAFTSLARAVAFMQRAVLAGAFKGINKVAKVRRETAAAWPAACLLNPTFHDARHAEPGQPWLLDPAAAAAGDE